MPEASVSESFTALKLVFCGTPAFAVPTLEALATAGHEIALVVTQPDRAAGRGMEVQAPAVKEAALRLGLPVVQPEKIRNNAEFREQMERLQPDAIVVVAYGRIIPLWMLQLPRLGNVNLHGSLLPKYRGAAPVQWAIANGEIVTGVTIMLLEEGLDTGPMLLAKAIPIAPEETATDVFASLAAIGAPLVVETLAGLADGTVVPIAQDHSLASLAPILTREDGRIDFSRTAQQILDRWRGFQPWPGAFTQFRGKKLIMHRMRVEPAERGVACGNLQVLSGQMLVGCGEKTTLRLVEVQFEGKKRMPAEDFLRGYQVRDGERLGA